MVTLWTAGAVVWILATWRLLAPPIRLVVEDDPARGLVYIEGGRLPGVSPWAGTPVASFYIDRFEVTQGDLEAWLREDPSADPPADWQGRSVPAERDPAEPARFVTLEQARRYAAWRGQRIPENVEWEWAALGVREQLFPWGNDATTVRANTLEALTNAPVAVGLFVTGVSAQGCFDLVGNVAEWTNTPSRAGGERYFVRGGGYNDPLLVRGEGRTILDTHAPFREDLSGRREWLPIIQRTEGPGTVSGAIGFRCVTDVDVVEQRKGRHQHLARQVTRLGARDPFGLWTEVWPAESELRRAGKEALPVLRSALLGTHEPRIERRLLDLIAEIEASEP